MIALYIISGIAILIFVLLMLWVKVTVSFKNDLYYTVKVGPFYLDLESDDDKEEKKDTDGQKGDVPSGKKAKKKATSESFSAKELYNAVFDLIDILKDFLSKYSHTLHFYSSKFYVRIGTGDAASTALECAAVKAAAAILFDFVDSFAIIDKNSEKNVNIIPDFTSDISECDIEIILRTRLGSLLRTLFTLFYRYIKKTVENEVSRIEKGQQQ